MLIINFWFLHLRIGNDYNDDQKDRVHMFECFNLQTNKKKKTITISPCFTVSR